MDSRKLDEKRFHDNLRKVRDDDHVADTRWSPEMEPTIRNNPLWANMKYYAIERRSRQAVLNWLETNCQAKTVLDYCCGNGADAVFCAQRGAREVVGIDISDISVENSHRLAEKHGLSNVWFRVADAENTGFDDNSFDIITEYGALHHLDLEKAYSEMARILKPDGKVICNEVLGHNRIIHLYRRLTPQLRTEWEVDHILRKKDIEMARDYFGRVDTKLFHLGTLFAVPFRRFGAFDSILAVLERLDEVLLKVPLIKWQAWQIVFIMAEPRK
ncbi:MAG: class I SAM-dependent methyltransferase [Deltaproteobacteria bacterium]|nr:class I SAM-dependent methyltransferase [Deltaproteobacteria bacterium]